MRTPAYDEEEFRALLKEQQTCQQERSMKYLQWPNGSCLREELVVAHGFHLGAPSRLFSIQGP